MEKSSRIDLDFENAVIEDLWSSDVCAHGDTSMLRVTQKWPFSRRHLRMSAKTFMSGLDGLSTGAAVA